MTEQPTPQEAVPQPTQRNNPSRFIPLIIISFALCLVLASAVVTRRVDQENKDFEQNVTKTIQAQIEIATGTAQAIMTVRAETATLTPIAEPTGTPSP